MKRSPQLLLVVCLLISIAGNLVLYNTARHYYTALNATRLDPLQLDEYLLTEWPLGDAEAVKVLLVGDSRAFHWPAPAMDDGWQFLNRGIGGQTSSQVQLRFATHVVPLQPDVIVIQVGINDLKSIPLFPERRAAIVATCQRNIAAMVAQARSMGAKVILTTIFPMGDLSLARRLVWSPAVAEAVAEVNTYLRTLTSDDVLLFDSAAILADGRGKTRPEYQVDLLHINTTGYAALNAQLLPLLPMSGK